MSRAALNFKLKFQEKKGGDGRQPYYKPNNPPPKKLTLDLPNDRPLTDQEFQKAAALQQSIYSNTSEPQKGNVVSHSVSPIVEGSSNTRVTVKRSGGGRTWEDTSLLEWDPTHFRLFVGNLSPGVTDDNLLQAFQKYPTMSKCKVVMDQKNEKNKGYGFVAFKDADDYFKAFKEMNGKYIGLRPIQLRRANTELNPTKVKVRRKPYDRKK